MRSQFRINTLLLIAVVYLFASGLSSALAQAPAAKVTYDDNIRAIFKEHCFACHAQERNKGGLTLDTYPKVMAGGSGGEVILTGDVENSRLYALVSHKEKPEMPPMQDKLSQAKIDLIGKWIEQGSPENAGSKIAVAKKKNPALMSGSVAGQPTGPAAMPEGLLKQPVVYTPRAGATTALAASPWAPLVAVAGQKQISLYNTDTLQLLGVLPFPEGIPYVLRFSRSGTVLLAGGGRGGHSGSVVLFDVKTGKRIAKIGEELDAVLAADISNDHSMVALGGPSKIVRIFSTESGQMVFEIKKHTDWIYSVQFSPDGVLLATADRSGGLFVWESATAREYLSLRGHNGAVCDVSWRLDSNVLASAGEDTTVRLWEMNDGNQIKNWGAHGGGVFSVNYAMDGRLVSAGRDNTVKSWAGDGAAQKTFPGFPEPALRTVFSFDGKRVIGGDWAGNVRVWDAAEATEVGLIPANPPTLAMVVEAKKADVVAKTPPAQATGAEAVAAQAVVVAKDAALKVSTEKLTAATAVATKAEADRVAAVAAAAVATAAVKTATDANTVAVAALKVPTDEKAAADVVLAAKAAAAKAAADVAAADKAAADKLTADKSADAPAAVVKATASATVATAAEAERVAAAVVVEQKAAALKIVTDAAAVAKTARCSAGVLATTYIHPSLRRNKRWKGPRPYCPLSERGRAGFPA